MTAILTTPLSDLAAWVEHLSRIDIPVLPETKRMLGDSAALEDSIDAHQLADIIVRDPLMCVKLYRHMANLRRGSQITDIESITGCLVMMGVPPFFRQFASLTPVAAAPGTTQRMWQGFGDVLGRAQRAAGFAFEWAVRRNDLDAEIIATAALLHDFTEMLLWCVAPTLATKVQDSLARHPGMRSSEAQMAFLGVEVDEIQRELMRHWRLPALLVRISDDTAGTDPQVRNVNLAVALARHSARGRDDPALPDDYAALGELLNISPLQARLLVADDEAAP